MLNQSGFYVILEIIKIEFPDHQALHEICGKFATNFM